MSSDFTVERIDKLVRDAKEVVPTVLPYRGYYFFPIDHVLSNNEKDALIAQIEFERTTCGRSEAN